MNILLIYLSFFLLLFVIIFIIQSIKIRKLSTKPKNKVHFYVARDMNDELWFYIGKPFRGDEKFFGIINIPLNQDKFNYWGLNKDDYANLKWEDGPVEVFLNLED